MGVVNVVLIEAEVIVVVEVESDMWNDTSVIVFVVITKVEFEWVVALAWVVLALVLLEDDSSVIVFVVITKVEFEWVVAVAWVVLVLIVSEIWVVLVLVIGSNFIYN